MALALLPVLLVTLAPLLGSEAGPDLGPDVCLICGHRAAADVVLNILLFLPLGWVIGRWKGSVWVGVWWGVAISGAIEVLQLFQPGRFTTLADVLANAGGAGLGAWIGTRTRLPVRLAGGAAFIALFAPAYLLAPSPPGGVYFGQWAAVFERMETYRGRVLGAWVGEIPVASGRSPRSPELRKALGDGTPIRVHFEKGPPPQGPAPVFSVYNQWQQEAIMLGVDGDDIFVRLPRRGTALRLQTPRIWWKDALRGIPVGDTVRIELSSGDRALCLDSPGGGLCQHSWTALESWSLLAPDGRGGLVVSAAGIFWGLLTGVPFGLFAFGFRGTVLLAGGLGALVAGLSLALPYWPTPWLGILLMLTGTILANHLELWIREKLER